MSKEFNGSQIVTKSYYHSIMRDDIGCSSDGRGKKPEFMVLIDAIDYIHNLLKEKGKLGIKIQEIENKVKFGKKGGIDPVNTIVLVNYHGEGRTEPRKLREVLTEFRRGNYYFSKSFKDKFIPPVVAQVVVTKKEVVTTIEKVEVINDDNKNKKGISIIISDSIYGYVSPNRTSIPKMKTIFIETFGTDLFSIMSTVIQDRNSNINMLSNEKLKAFDLRVLSHLATSLKTLKELGLCAFEEKDFEILNKGITISEFEKKSEIFQENMKELNSVLSTEFRF